MIFFFTAILLFIGIYTLLFSRNLMRILIGLEILVKGVTLALVSAAHATNSLALGQTLFITMIVIEVIVAVIVLAFVVNVYRQTESLDIRNLTRLRG
jgi:NADH:ubiquinone oxidoreductase subunit K